MKAVLLAAGRGKRLRPLTDAMPKPLLPLGGKPLAEYILLGLQQAGITQALMITGWLAEKMEQHFGDGAQWGFQISYKRQHEQTGSGSATLLAEEFVGSEPFLLTFADILVSHHNYGAILQRFAEQRCDALLGLNEIEDPWAGAAVYRDGDRITALVEKPRRGTSSSKWNNAGVMILTPHVFPALRALPKSERGEYELPQAVIALVAQARLVLGFELSGFWSDVGTVEEYSRVNALLESGALTL
jgi:NDP-sugar pyrophosphorylase family protein